VTRAARLAALAPLLALAACTRTIHPLERPNAYAARPAAFSHADLDRVLRRFVDADGLVDYAGLAREPFDLGRYLGQLAAWSPDRTPALFPTEAARLAYWINAYDAMALRFVLDQRPIASVRDVRPWWAPLVPEGSGFFVGLGFPLGGRSTTLRHLEDRVVRRRFADPRVHFALVGASRGGPALPREAFDPARLDAQLARATRRFVGEARNVRVEPAARTVWLSAIFDGYTDDFTRWQAQHGRESTLLGFVADHAGASVAAEAARAEREGFAVRFAPYDWRLNDQALGPRPVGRASGLDLRGRSAHHARALIPESTGARRPPTKKARTPCPRRPGPFRPCPT